MELARASLAGIPPADPDGASASSAGQPARGLIGHNGGPPLEDEPDPGLPWRSYCWRRAHKKAWKTPPREIALRRLARAEELGVTYRAYALEIMERGRYL